MSQTFSGFNEEKLCLKNTNQWAWHADFIIRELGSWGPEGKHFQASGALLIFKPSSHLKNNLNIFKLALQARALLIETYIAVQLT